MRTVILIHEHDTGKTIHANTKQEREHCPFCNVKAPVITVICDNGVETKKFHYIEPEY